MALTVPGIWLVSGERKLTAARIAFKKQRGVTLAQITTGHNTN